MAWTLALVVAGLTAAGTADGFDLEGPRAEASAQGRAFATVGQVPFSDLQVEGRGEATLEAQQRLDVPRATYGDVADFRASVRFGAQRVEVELLEAGLPPALRDDVAVAPPWAIEGGVALDQRLYDSQEGLSGFVTPVQAAISVWGVGRVSLNGRVLTERALVHVTALRAGARSDDAQHLQLPEARPGDLELEVLALGVPGLGFVQLGFDEDVRISVDGAPLPRASAPLLEDAMPYRSLDATAQLAQNRAQGVPDPGVTVLRPTGVPPNALERPLVAATREVPPGSGSGAEFVPPRALEVPTTDRTDSSDPVVEITRSAAERVEEVARLARPEDATGGAGAASPTGTGSDGAAPREAGRTGNEGGAPGADDVVVAQLPREEGVTAPSRDPAVEGAARPPAAPEAAPEGSGRIAGIAPANAAVDDEDVQIGVPEDGIPPANAEPAERGVRVLRGGNAPLSGVATAGTEAPLLLAPAPLGMGATTPGIAPMQQGIAPLGLSDPGIEINDGNTPPSTVRFGPGAQGPTTFGPGSSEATVAFGPGSQRALDQRVDAAPDTAEASTGSTPRTGLLPGIAPLNAAPSTALPQGIQPLNAQPAAPVR